MGERKDTRLFLILLMLTSALGRGAEYPENPNPEPEPKESSMTEEEREESLKAFNQEWEKYMLDFDFTDSVNFEIYAGSKRTFNEKISSVPVVFRGFYAVASEDSHQIVMNIYDPKGTNILTKQRVKDAIIYLNLNLTGTYTLEFINNNVNSRHPASTMQRRKCNFIFRLRLQKRPAELKDSAATPRTSQ